jgi:hypothetical protein
MTRVIFFVKFVIIRVVCIMGALWVWGFLKNKENAK